MMKSNAIRALHRAALLRPKAFGIAFLAAVVLVVLATVFWPGGAAGDTCRRGSCRSGHRRSRAVDPYAAAAAHPHRRRRGAYASVAGRCEVFAVAAGGLVMPVLLWPDGVTI